VHVLRVRVTSNTAAENSDDGLVNGGTGDTLKGNHLLNNGNRGLVSLGSGSQISCNIANGNANDGIGVLDNLATLTGNTANYNSALGINAVSPQIHAGRNEGARWRVSSSPAGPQLFGRQPALPRAGATVARGTSGPRRSPGRLFYFGPSLGSWSRTVLR
jgi:hypothetical protein